MHLACPKFLVKFKQQEVMLKKIILVSIMDMPNIF